MLLTLRKADCVIAVSQTSARFCRSLGLPEERIVVVPNGVDLSCFNRKVDGSLIRKQLSLDNSPLVVTALRLIKRKNPAQLISAFAKVLKVIPDAKLVIAGSGREKDNLTRQVKRLNITNSVFLPGILLKEQIAQLMALANVFVLPSRTEAFGLAALEAAATGVPVVCPNSGGIPEVFQNGFDALLYPPGDDSTMAESMIRLLQDKELARKLGENGIRTAGKFTWEIAARRMLQVYEKVCQENASGRFHC